MTQAVDIRAQTFCSLGTIISGNLADTYAQGSGLITTRGSVELSGIYNPPVGTRVEFGYAKGGFVARLPRTVRVLSSFADPFRRKTTVQLGCLLTFLENRKPPVEDPSTRDENDVPGYVYDKVILPISAKYVVEQILSTLGIKSDTVPLTNYFSVEKFDLTPGFIQVLGDLLVSEGYIGYLNEAEKLKFRDLSAKVNKGPVLDSRNIIDINPIGVGDLPGDAVIVNYSSLRLKQPDGDESDDDRAKRNWESDEVYGAAKEVSATYTDANGNNVTVFASYTPYSLVTSSYDNLDRVVARVSTETIAAAEANSRFAADRASIGNNILASANTRVSRTKFTYNSNGDVYEERTENFISQLELAATLNLDSYKFVGSDGQTSIPGFGAGPTILDSVITVSYDKDQASGVTKTVTSSSIIFGKTTGGQQDIATLANNPPAITTYNEFASWIDFLLARSGTLKSQGTEVRIRTEREYGLQRRPSQQDRNNSAYAKPEVTEQKAAITWVTGGTESTNYIEFTMPYAPDDRISWLGGSSYTSTPSDAGAKALKFGRIQNRLLLGNRNGISIQIPAELMPPRPFDPLYVEADNLTAQYRVNAATYSFDSNGIVASADCLFWGGVG